MMRKWGYLHKNILSILENMLHYSMSYKLIIWRGISFSTESIHYNVAHHIHTFSLWHPFSYTLRIHKYHSYHFPQEKINMLSFKSNSVLMHFVFYYFLFSVLQECFPPPPVPLSPSPQHFPVYYYNSTILQQE